MLLRQIVLDTETTGLDPKDNHRIIEIGAIELIDREFTGKHFHVYINPHRSVDPGAFAVHGISDSFLSDKPSFNDIFQDFFNFITGAQLVIHNAAFDLSFVNAEFKRLGKGLKPIEQYCSVLDTLALARHLHPGQKNSLDALCKRYQVDNTRRQRHGALLDAELLAQVYLGMSTAQYAFSSLSDDKQNACMAADKSVQNDYSKQIFPIIVATEEECVAHRERLTVILKKVQNPVLAAWAKKDIK